MVGPTKRASEQGPPIDLLDSLERERGRPAASERAMPKEGAALCFHSSSKNIDGRHRRPTMHCTT